MQQSPLDEQTLFHEYIVNGKSDRMIAQEYGCDRTNVVKKRQQFGINTRLETGEIGEHLTRMELRRLGFAVADMNRTESKTHPFDLLVNRKVKVDVKSARACKDGYWRFSLTSKRECGNSLKSGNYILLNNGRMKKIFANTCDLLVFCTVGDRVNFYIMPSNIVPVDQNSITLSTSHTGKWSFWRNRWDLLTKLAA